MAYGLDKLPTTRKEYISSRLAVWPEAFLGEGKNGTRVLKGTFRDLIPVAVKRTYRFDTNEESQEVKLLRENPHENIVQFYDHGSDKNFFYIAMEWCAGTLDDLVLKTYQGPSPGNNAVVLYQISKGVEYLHSRNVVHRDLKPTNILISKPLYATGLPVMKLADFGNSKQKPKEYYFSNTGTGGTMGWTAPELIPEDNKGPPEPFFSLKIDIFSLGCIFGYFLTDGAHPYGDGFSRTANIVTKKMEWKKKKGVVRKSMKSLIRSMVAYEPKNRPAIASVLENPFFTKLELPSNENVPAKSKTPRPLTFPAGEASKSKTTSSDNNLKQEPAKRKISAPLTFREPSLMNPAGSSGFPTTSNVERRTEQRDFTFNNFSRDQPVYGSLRRISNATFSHGGTVSSSFRRKMSYTSEQTQQTSTSSSPSGFKQSFSFMRSMMLDPATPTSRTTPSSKKGYEKENKN